MRWWHASEPKMRAMLQAAGLDNVRLDMIKAVVDTCRECRAWKRPGNAIIASVSIPTKFNEEGEADLLFYKRHIAFHIIDLAIRLSDGCEIPNKQTDTLLDAYITSWVQRNGAFKVLHMDGETGMNNETAIAELKRLGTQFKVRAPGQHTRTSDKRIAILRHVMHLIEEDLTRYGIEITFKRLFGEGLFVCNAFTFYNGASPYNAHTGRQPACLPDLENIDFDPNGENTDGQRERRIRETSLEAITQSTAVAKTTRALKAQTTLDGSRLY